MGTKLNISGERYGRLVVIAYHDMSTSRKSRWVCRCDCGNETVAIGNDLRSGAQISCGCARVEAASENMRAAATKHGLAYSPVYKAWKGLIQRCYNPNNKDYPRYKNRKPCEAIRNSVVNLIAVIGEKPSADLTVHRINNDGGYWCGACAECVSLDRPMNIKWADDFEQCRHQKTNRLITYNGETHCMSEWAEKVGITSNALALRLNRLGWSIDRALTTPMKVVRRSK